MTLLTGSCGGDTRLRANHSVRQGYRANHGTAELQGQSRHGRVWVTGPITVRSGVTGPITACGGVTGPITARRGYRANHGAAGLQGQSRRTAGLQGQSRHGRVWVTGPITVRGGVTGPITGCGGVTGPITARQSYRTDHSTSGFGLQGQSRCPAEFHGQSRRGSGQEECSDHGPPGTRQSRTGHAGFRVTP